MLPTAFLICLIWGVIASPFIILVKIGANPVPKPPDRLRYWNRAAGSGELMNESPRLAETGFCKTLFRRRSPSVWL